MIWRLRDDDPTLFPDPHYGEEDGMIAVGGDLSPMRLLTAYSNGVFPWYGFKECDDIHWYCPMDRFVIFPDEIHVSHSMRQLIKKGTYHVTVNKAFEQVIRNCSEADGRNVECGAWLGDDMIEAYTTLHKLGFAASVEVWDADENLVGGLYGVTLGENQSDQDESPSSDKNIEKTPLARNFFGESMFSLVPSASKLALIHLAQQLQGKGGIIDCQFETAHLKSMGGRHITYDEYMKKITSACCHAS